MLTGDRIAIVPQYAPLALGTSITPYGTIEGILSTNGERFYLLVDMDEAVSLLDDHTARTAIADAAGDYWTDSDGINRNGGAPQ